MLFIPLLVLSWSLFAQERGQAGVRGQGRGQAQTQAPGRGQGAGPVQGQPPGGGRFSPKLGGEYTRLVSEELAKGPVPRLPNGNPDLSGPWVGGGSNDDIEKQGGLKPGELPLLPWAKALRDARKEDDEPYLYCTPMSVPRMNPYPWRFVQSSDIEGPRPIYIIHENGDAGAVRQIFMDGRKHPDPRRLDPDMVGTFDRPVGRRHARHRHGGLQRQVLVRQPRDAAHREAAHDRAVDAYRISGRSSTISRSTTRAPCRTRCS